MTRRTPATVAAATVVLTLATGGAALAAWQKPGTGAAAGHAATLAAPGKPSGTPTGLSVALSWAGSLTPGNGPASYAVERALFGSSSWTTVCTPGTATSCTDTTPSGADYQYRVSAILGTSWLRSSPVSDRITTVATTTTPSTPNLLDADDSGVSATDNVTNDLSTQFHGTAAANALVRLYRDGVEVGSQQLTAGATSWAIPLSAPAEGNGVQMTATAQVAGQLVSAAAPALAVTFDRTAPAVTAFRLSASDATSGIVANGTVQNGDTFLVTYSTDIAPSTLCSAWTGSGPGYAQGGNGVVTVTLVSNGAANDDVGLSTSSGCTTLRFGSIATNANYKATAGNLPFNGNGSNASTLAYSATTGVLTVQLGGNGVSSGTSIAAATPSYTPAAGITDLAGNALPTATFTGSSSRF